MNTIELISSHPDLYDALADYYDFDLVNFKTTNELIEAIKEKIASNHDDELQANLSMLKAFIEIIDKLNINETKTPDTRTTEEIEDDRFLKFILENSREYYFKENGCEISPVAFDAFKDSDIRNCDDLSDNDEAFNTREYEAFEDAIESWEAIQNKD